MSLTPHEALRLSKADALLRKHGEGSGFKFADDSVITVEKLADLLDEAMAAKDATIKALRKEVQDAYKEADRDARDAYSQGQGDEAERQRDNN